MDRTEILKILASAGLRPQHQFGQNFMIDQNILAAIADAGDIGPDDVILEVGPGVGNLTRQLASRAHNGAVLAVDIDYKLMPAAQRYHAALTNVTWINTDVLAGKHEVEQAVLAKLRELRAHHPAGQLKLVSNLPYNAASPLIAELLVEMWREQSRASAPRSHTPDPIPQTLFFSRLAFTVQHEVALRMAAHSGTRDYGPLGILIQAMSNVEIIRRIPAGAFWPPPKIQSALVVVKPVAEKIARIHDALALQSLLQGIFSHRRQTLGNALKHHLGERWTDLKTQITNAGFDLQKRGEELPIEAFLKLAEITTPNPPPN
ncbi:MAG TPA: 16S rRNA (adenine(1518)-N(6)/adenine(1519)-N(6))-dimethyltransferase RsmA [Phycisphaerae bacterium]|nr:16S rRNA (adenine(1518)-N(6)/adenine(1519)-N(6))-dimethyltransferase RsmA [Phycisphaerae bacterium]